MNKLVLSGYHSKNLCYNPSTFYLTKYVPHFLFYFTHHHNIQFQKARNRSIRYTINGTPSFTVSASHKNVLLSHHIINRATTLQNENR